MPEAATLFKEWSGYLKPEDVTRLETAYHFSEAAHHGQFRASGDPYISHPLAVANILAQLHLDSQALTAALLHDVMEDTAVTKAEISRKFGKPVADLVDGVSKLDRIEFETHEEAQAENFRKMLLAMARDVRVILIKLADRLHNMRTLDAVPAEEAQAHRARDARNLRADRQPAGPEQHLPGTRGPQLQLPLSDAQPRAVEGAASARAATGAKWSARSSTRSRNG